MKNGVRSLLLWGAVMLSSVASLHAEGAGNLEDLKRLVEQYLPQYHIRVDGLGKPLSLRSAADEVVLDVTKIPEENPAPTEVVGYWYSPTMNFLSGKKIKVETAQEAIGVVKLWHTLWRGPDFVQQKLYEARPFEGGWVIQVDHNFAKYPGSVQELMPYELLVDRDHRLTQLRERCYHYPGSEAVYTNAVISVYEREKKIQGGVNYPEVLEKWACFEKTDTEVVLGI